MSQRRTFADQSFSLVFGGLTLLGLLILVGPVLIVLITSFTTSASLKFPPPELSLRWYQALFDTTRSAHIHRAAGNSLWVAGMATLGRVFLPSSPHSPSGGPGGQRRAPWKRASCRR